jgi:hypothetical protein
VADAKTYSVEEFQNEPEVWKPDKRSWTILEGVINHFKNDKFICGPSGNEVGIVLLGGMERGFMELLQNPETVKAATKYELEQKNKLDEYYIHPDSDGVLWGADFGFKTGPFISPEMFRDMFVPANRSRVQNIRQHYNKKVLKHCCGNVQDLLDDFIEIGYDAYQSIQPTANMDICKIKQSHGDKITLWGGVAVENLIGGTPEEVREDVRRAMECAKPDGRFILGSSHSIAVGTQYDNFMAMLDQHQKECRY